MIYILVGKAIDLLSLFYVVFILLEMFVGRKRDRKSYGLKILLCDAIFCMALVLLLIQHKTQMPLDMRLILLMFVSTMGMLLNYEAYKSVKREENEQKK